ncbi:Pyrogallol hydroxytransferase large subunit [uncultured Roseburia sp.]|uniref:Molybdopterin-dependent oxidoreductase n=1 Tax=Brotonthovivens ammoniilytica TaxID=2981725 RepID=A0ABT2TJU8_9FIRM|nr:molybdopterin-dependent oxidoreductase [Brotonthovivens ammoniilytica]MCU6762465.1 molybdopterin-dependent oxidoreductase [Brotonthovivens ammoniilytica]SCI72617.1 Pyrogallol hydroxytransferase large subunit [uncultured Roseburia sp.]
MGKSIVDKTTSVLNKTALTGTLFVLDKLLNGLAAACPAFKDEWKDKELKVQIRIGDGSAGRMIEFSGGRVTGRNGIFRDASVEMVFAEEKTAMRVMTGMMMGKQDEFVNAAKAGGLALNGPDEDAMWFSSLLLKVFAFDVLYLKNYGTKMPNGEVRYVNATNGGPVFVYVKDGKIVRITPIDFEDSDADPWTITAKGKKFTPPKRATVAPYAFWKSLIYSKDRLLYPMKRVDFDPNGERHPENRGISGYERISWEEALDIVSNEIVRVRKENGPGSVFFTCGSHHTWGNIGYYLSAAKRFFNCLGATTALLNPDSWEGFAWGAIHHYGGSARNGGCEIYSTVEDCMQNSDMIVFWSSDPETTAGVYGAQEGTIRRSWIKELGMKTVHIDPYENSTAAFVGGRWIAPKPGTDAAMAIAIANVWMNEGTYDKDYVATRTYGFEKWEAYVLGETDGTPKTPEWQEPITGVPARIVRALAQEWARNKTYLACGGITSFGGAGRVAFGTEWARAMVCLIFMQGCGKPGINFGGLQYGTPLDTRFWFPGYADGGFSGDFIGSGAGVALYNRMPQSPSVNSEYQQIPRLRIPEAIIEKHTEAHNMPVYSVHGQFCKVSYPAPGHSPVKMYYKYGGSHIGTQPQSKRFAQMYRTDSLEFVVNQSIWLEGEARFADVLLPACTNFERWDIAESGNCGGYIEKSYLQNNHRVCFIQHKCIEPLGESKSDFEIFQAVANRIGLWQVFSEGNSEYDWAKRYFDATDLKKKISWHQLLKKGYYVVPPLPEDRRDPVAFRWFANGTKKDTPELSPLPSEYYGRYNEGLQTPSGLFEFEAQTLKRFDPDDEERRPICMYHPSWEGCETTKLYEKYPLQLISPHSKYSFHTMGDGKDSNINDIEEHRRLIDGFYYWIFRMNPADAKARGLKEDDIVEVYNDRGNVLCALQLTQRVPAGTVHSFEACADYRPMGEPGGDGVVEKMGCINNLTNKRFLVQHAHGMGANSCLVEVRKWEGETK